MGELMSDISEKQLAANRANALKSTGPTSEEGKNIVRANAYKHGLSATNPSSLLMPGESEDALRELGARLRENLKPVGDMEELLVDRIESCAWRLKRIERVEAGLFAYGFLEKKAQLKDQEIENPAGVTDTTVEHPSTSVEATGFLQDAQTNNAFAKLSRYEAGLERSLYKALEELKKLQFLRRKEAGIPFRRVVR
jgi:hypothetical protein